LFIALTNCKKEKDPPVASFTVDRNVAEVNEMITCTNTSQNADSYLWEFGDGMTSTEINPLHFYSSSGDFRIVLKATNDGGTDTTSQLVSVYNFIDNFSSGDSKWSFDYCDHTVSGGILTMISTHSTAQSVAETDEFSSAIQVPWTLKGDIAIIDNTSAQTDNGISVKLDDAGTFAVDFMWLSIRLNDSDADWIWLWWIPSLLAEWLPWDGSCYGNSSSIHTDGQWNTLEMTAGTDNRFTLKANGVTLSSNNNAVNDFEDMASISVGTGIEYIKIRGGNDTETDWDNILLSSGTNSGGFHLKSAQSNRPAPVTDEYIDGLLKRIEQGEDITLKSLLKQKLNK
jgi:PKD repeat protein